MRVYVCCQSPASLRMPPSCLGMQLEDASDMAAAWAPEVVRDQLQAFRSSDDLLSFFTELKDLLHVSSRLNLHAAMPAD